MKEIIKLNPKQEELFARYALEINDGTEYKAKYIPVWFLQHGNNAEYHVTRIDDLPLSIINMIEEYRDTIFPTMFFKKDMADFAEFIRYRLRDGQVVTPEDVDVWMNNKHI